MIHRAGGFTLVEVLVAVAISTFLLVSFTDLYVIGLNSYHGMREQSSLALDSILAVDYLRSELMIAGGGQVRGWQGIWVENDCNARGPLPDCKGSDRITVSSTNSPLQQCSITGNPGPGVWQVNFSSPSVCCLAPGGGLADFLEKQVMFTLSDYYSSKFVKTVDPVSCRMTVTSGQAAGNDFTGTPSITNWTGAVVTLTTVKTFYWDSAKSSLMRFIDRNGDDNPDSEELSTVAIGIYDLQAALGYDSSPADGNIVAAADGVNDEWLYNAPGVVESWSAGAFVAPATRSQLLMVNVGLILGVKNTNGSGSSTARILNGPIRSVAGFMLQPQLGQVAPRNSYVFQ
jgi:prepilin-type N-terminal cleavage/methylation domain-containing protein